MDLETNTAEKQEIRTPGSHGRSLVGRARREFADEYLEYNYENGVLQTEKKLGARIRR